MGIVLKDGTVLPDIPTEYSILAGVPDLPDIATLQYCFVVCAPGLAAGDYGDYGLVMSGVPFAKLLLSETDDALEYLMPSDFSAGVVLWFNRADGSGWIDAAVSGYSHELIFFARMKGTEEPLWGALGDLDNVMHLVWSNHDIVCGTMDTETGAISLTEEIYFPNSVSKPPFILPDGTEIPAFPDGWSDGSPYGALIFWDLRSDYSTQFMCALYASDKPLLSLPDELLPDPSANLSPGNPILCVQPGFFRGFQYIGPDGAWDGEAGEGESTALMPSMPTAMVVWSNHDILNITSASEDGSSYTVGTQIAYQSNENYRITGGYMTSIANEARRLGGVSGALTPAAMETALRGAE